jgi:hypothetical protein
MDMNERQFLEAMISFESWARDAVWDHCQRRIESWNRCIAVTVLATLIVFALQALWLSWVGMAGCAVWILALVFTVRGRRQAISSRDSLFCQRTEMICNAKKKLKEIQNYE